MSTNCLHTCACIQVYATYTQILVQMIIENHERYLVPKTGLFDRLHFLSKNKTQMFACCCFFPSDILAIKARRPTPERQGLYHWAPSPAPDRLSRKVYLSWRCSSVVDSCLVCVQGPIPDPQHCQKNRSNNNCFVSYSLVLNTLKFYCCKTQTARASFGPAWTHRDGPAAAGVHTLRAGSVILFASHRVISVR